MLWRSAGELCGSRAEPGQCSPSYTTHPARWRQGSPASAIGATHFPPHSWSSGWAEKWLAPFSLAPFSLAPFSLQPVRGKVLEVLKNREAKITLGSGDGVFKGLKLFVIAAESRSDAKAVRPYAFADVLSVDASASTARALVSEGFRGFNQGDVVSSRIPREIVDRRPRSRHWLVP
jgi:hypothetical protein